MNVEGHLWTVGGYLRRRWQTVTPPRARVWGTQIDDPRVGSVHISGQFTELDEDGPLLLVVHGLGGCSESTYVVRAATCAVAEGLSCLRINLRGADRSGEDVYHAGLTADLHAAAASPELARFHQILVLGYSLGGHVALRFAVETSDPRVRAVVAVCSPLLLAAGARAIDSPAAWIYRRYLLANLVECYEKVAARKPVPAPLAEVRRLRKIEQFDDLVVAPRHGFTDAQDYYAQASVGPVLDALARPAMLVASESDPMVPPAAVRPILDGRPPLEVKWVEGGGHLGFDSRLDLGIEGAKGLEGQVLAWLTRHL
jgi:predicted alpha/beta-fold hydrolase